MRYYISISKREIFTAIILIIGFILLFKGIHSYYKVNYALNHALDIQDLNEQMLKDGDYVIGDIDTYIGQKMYGSGQFSGVSQTLITSGKDYNFYTIPLGQNAYICIMAYSETVLKNLKAFENGHGESIPFTGIIIEPPIDLNYDWYDYVEDFDTKDLIDSFVIKEVLLDWNKNLVYGGVILLALAALLFFSGGGIKNIVMKEADNTRPVYSNDTKIYNRDYELQAEKKQLETLERRLKSAKRNAALCLLLLLIGIYIVYSAYLLEGKLFGVLLLIISVRGIWNYFINSSNTLAKSLARRFTLKSLSAQIEEHKNNIKKLDIVQDGFSDRGVST